MQAKANKMLHFKASFIEVFSHSRLKYFHMEQRMYNDIQIKFQEQTICDQPHSKQEDI